MGEHELLRVDGLSKRFGPTVALSDVSLTVGPGEGLAVVGENGAGKSTLMKIVAGAHRPDEGSMTLHGGPYAPHQPIDATEAGIVTVYQEPVFLPALSVTENLFAGREIRTRFGGIAWDRMREDARRLLERFGLDPEVGDREMQELTVAQQQLSLIARAFHHQADLLILDEPTSALSDVEADRLFTSVREWQADGGAVLYITHRLRELPEVCQRIAVLRDGALVGTHTISEPFEPTRRTIVEEMSRREHANGPATRAPAVVGHDDDEAASPIAPPSADGEVRLETEGLTRAGEFTDVSLTLRAGEVRGMYGLVGSGRTEFALTLYGERRPDVGDVRIGGESVSFKGPRDAKRHGLMYLPEDRGRDGLYGFLSVRANLSSAVLDRLRRFGPLLDFARERTIADGYIDELSIRTSAADANVMTLSGGSQQKVLLGRSLSVEPSILLLDEPTRGVDVGTKEEFYARIRELAADGLAVLVISSELNDLLAVADTVDVMRTGEIIRSVDVAEEGAAQTIVQIAIGADDVTDGESRQGGAAASEEVS